MDHYIQHDPNLIIQAAEEKKAAGDMAGAHLMFESALLEWGDEAREGGGGAGEQLQDAIATLWLAYADFHRGNKAWKSAMDTYEQAIHDPTIQGVGRVYLEYARFAEERDKLVTAQKIYLEALVGDGNPKVTDEQDNTLLWNEFLAMMRLKNSSLTLASLKEAVSKEHAAKRAQPDGVSSTDEPEEKKYRSDSGAESKTYVVTADEVEAEKAKLMELIAQMPPEISAAWMARDGDAPPQAPEPPLFSPTRPKMSDASGRELIGDEMALRVTERLLSDSGTVLLEACRALWLTTALLEKESFQALESADKAMTKEFMVMQTNHDARLSVAGAARTAVQMMNENERKSFELSCSQRRHEVLAKYAWAFRNLLCTQQTILTPLDVPGFEGPSVDAHTLEFQSSVCTLLHTAFFLRKNLGADRHKKMLETQRDRLEKDRRSPVHPSSRSPPRSPIPPLGMPPRIPSPVPGVYGRPPPPPPHMLYGQPPPPPGNYVGYPPPPHMQTLPPPPPPQHMMPPGGSHFGGPPPHYHQ